jgi:DNA-binding NarL/FixJ family response regulator
VIDLNMPNGSGTEALRQITAGSPSVQVVVLTISADDGDVRQAIAAGACSYLLKDTRVDDLVSGIRQAAGGHAVLSREVAQALMTRMRSEPGVGNDQGEKRPTLTERETEVLKLIAGGADNAAIGQALSISPHTVKQYVTNIFEKLEVHTRVQAAVYAVRTGLA